MSGSSRKSSNLNSLNSLLAEAVALHQQGRVQEAQARYSDVLQADPANIQARYFQGLLRLQLGDMAGGIAALKQVIKRAPSHAEAYYNLGLAYNGQGNMQQALRCFEKVVAFKPDMAEACFYLGMVQARLDKKHEAITSFERAIKLNPGLAEAYLNLGSALNELGRHTQAMSHFEKALKLKPGFAEAYNGLGLALASQGLFDAAITQFKQAIVQRADYVDAYAGLGHALQEMGQSKAARSCWEKVIEFSPSDAMAHASLGRSLVAMGEPEQALACFYRALDIEDTGAEVHLWMGQALCNLGRYAEGLAHLEQAASRRPDDIIYTGSLLFYMHYDPKKTAEEVAKQHRQFGERFERGGRHLRQCYPNAPDPERTLKVGFVSGDFCRHPVGYFLTDLLVSLGSGAIEIFAYANQRESDDLTGRIKSHVKAWCECIDLSDEELDAQIRSDGIDILVDLSGYTDVNRLLLFARKPAPIQVTYLGYPDTTGLTAIDYILGDSLMFPREEEALYVEKPWRLPDLPLAFAPPDIPVEVGQLPLEENAYVTFGCLNKWEKMANDDVIKTWAKILHEVPESRLLLQNELYGGRDISSRVHNLFLEHGISPGRLILIGKLSWREHLETYNRVDIALDPYPYNGTTTSIEGLWMGVPLLSLNGDRLVAHMGESILHAVGMEQWVARDKNEYVAKAVAFANDIPALSAIRAGLRERLLASPVCDAPRLAKNMENGFRGMWKEWCESRSKQ